MYCVWASGIHFWKDPRLCNFQLYSPTWHETKQCLKWKGLEKCCGVGMKSLRLHAFYWACQTQKSPSRHMIKLHGDQWEELFLENAPHWKLWGVQNCTVVTKWHISESFLSLFLLCLSRLDLGRFHRTFDQINIQHKQLTFGSREPVHNFREPGIR